MNTANAKKLGVRATTLGNSADAAVFEELMELVRSESALVRRLAASAMGKLASIVNQCNPRFHSVLGNHGLWQ